MSPFSGKRIAIAGGSGMVGNALIQQSCNIPNVNLVASYHQHPPHFTHPAVTYKHLNLSDKSASNELLKSADLAILAAAVTGGAKSHLQNPHQQVNQNLILNANLLEACYLEGVKRVIFISSASVYQPCETPIREDMLDLNADPVAAHFGVGWVFRALEKLCQFWSRQGLNIQIVRASNIFGPCATFDPERSNFIPALIRKAVDKIEPFYVWGHPDVTRDVIYVSDFADAVLRLGYAKLQKFDIFNVGYGETVTVKNVVEWALQAANHQPDKIEFQNQQPMTIQQKYLDCSKFKQTLAWKPHYTPQEGINKTTQWWMENRSWWTR